MTKSTITRERLEKIKSWRETYGAGSNVMLPAEEAEELARMALAAMDSEPVAWTDEEELRDANESGSGYLFGIERDANKFADPRRQIMLYRHAQPAPVVPEALQSIRSIVADPRRLPRRREWIGGQQYSYVLLEEVEAIVEDACRTAMLQAGDAVRDLSTPVDPQVAEYEQNVMQADNSPVIPDGYVMVPKEPTESMINAWLSEVANWRGHVAGYKAMLEATQPAPTIQVTNAMAYAFHHALTDGPLGDDDVEDIKTGLRSAFANVSTNQSVLVVPDRFIFEKWWETQNGSPLDGWDSLRTTDGYCDEVIDGQFEAWRACRSAMCATDKSSNHADCQSKLIKNCASGASAKQHG